MPAGVVVSKGRIKRDVRALFPAAVDAFGWRLVAHATLMMREYGLRGLRLVPGACVLCEAVVHSSNSRGLAFVPTTDRMLALSGGRVVLYRLCLDCFPSAGVLVGSGVLDAALEGALEGAVVVSKDEGVDLKRFTRGV